RGKPGGYRVMVRDKPPRPQKPAAPAPTAAAPLPAAPAEGEAPAEEEGGTFRHPTEGVLRLAPDQTGLARGVVAFDQVMPGGQPGRRGLLNKAVEADKGIDIPSPPTPPEHQVGASVEWTQPGGKVVRGVVQAEPDNRNKVQVIDTAGRKRSINRDELRMSPEKVTVNVPQARARETGINPETDTILQAIRK